MIITEDYVKAIIEEVAPLVEKLSLLECDLIGSKIEFSYTMPKQTTMRYSPLTKSFILNKDFSNGNKEYFKLIIGHELMHNAQYCCFPNLVLKEWELPEYEIAYALYNKEIGNPIKKLTEGDAINIQKKLNKEYFKNAEYNTKDGSFASVQNLKFKVYSEWGNILNEKFNGDREKINKLYTLSIDELISIFGTTRIIKE